MKAILQKVKHSSVKVNDKLINEIDYGLNILIGFEKDDNYEKLQKMAKRIVNLRIFGDRFEKNIQDIKGKILLISNFTIPAITKKGSRPNFQNSMPFNEAKVFYDKMLEELNKFVITKGGVFGEMMEVNIINDGPVTLILEV